MNILTHKREKCRSQKGSVVIHVAIFLSLAVILFIGTELGYLFYLKRDFQKAADLAALAGAQALNANNCTAAFGAARSNANDGADRNMPATYSLTDADMACGKWSSQDTTHENHFDEIATEKNAIRVSITRTPDPLFIFFTGNRTISVQAIAAKQIPRAALNIRSTLLNVETEQSPLLNVVIGGLLGGNLNVAVVGWRGLVDTDVKLLDYLDALAIDLDVTVGDYDRLLQTEATAGQLLQAVVTALELQRGTIPGATLDAAITALGAIKDEIKIPSIKKLTVGEILNVQSGTLAAGLETNLQVFKLMEGIVQLANSHSAAVAGISISVPKLVSALVKVKVIEPPQVSAVGNPELAKQDPTGPNQISVRTAQVRALISVEIQGLANVVNDLLDAVFLQISPITSFVNSVLHLKLFEALGNILSAVACPVPLLGIQCESSEVIYTRITPAARIDVGLEAASGRAHIKDFSCNSSENKTLLVPASTAAVTLRIGQWGATSAQAEAAFFPPEEVTQPVKAMPDVKPASLIEIGRQIAKPDYCLLTLLCGDWKWKKGTTWILDRKQADFTLESALGIKADTDILGSSGELLFSSPSADHLPEISGTPYFQKITSQNLAGSLKSTFAGISIEAYKSTSSGILGNLLTDAANLLNSVINSLGNILGDLLSPLLDPLLNFLLTMLGVDVARTEVGGRLSCKVGAELVY